MFVVFRNCLNFNIIIHVHFRDYETDFCFCVLYILFRFFIITNQYIDIQNRNRFLIFLFLTVSEQFLIVLSTYVPLKPFICSIHDSNNFPLFPITVRVHIQTSSSTGTYSNNIAIQSRLKEQETSKTRQESKQFTAMSTSWCPVHIALNLFD